MSKEYHELRFVEKSNAADTEFLLFDDTENKITLVDVVSNNDYVFLLGNPGLGKTTELKSLFKVLWEQKQETQIVPFFVNIKNFRTTMTIDHLITIEDWQTLPAILFIFDGLDEIGNIRDFIAELENFISKYSEIKLKVIVSCRTNIYQKYLLNVTNLQNFEKYYLKSLSFSQIENILIEKYELKVPLNEIQQYNLILQTPFYLDFFAEYYKLNNKFPNSIGEALEIVLEKEINRTMEMLPNRFDLSKAFFNSLLGEVGITNELMQQNAISEESLLRLLGQDSIKIFQELPFIIRSEFAENYSFIHKNYQEYYAARFLSFLESIEIIKFLKAEAVDNLKPSLFNTTTFLLNILEGEKGKELRDWLLKNEIEILFFADGNRLGEEFKDEIFRRYFTEICINKTYWINNSQKLSMEILASFANFDFLIENLFNHQTPYRARGSALELLAQKSLKADQSDFLKHKLLLLLEQKSDIPDAEILRTIRTKGYHTDAEYLKKTFSHVKDTKTKDVYHQIIAIESDLDDNQRDEELFVETIKAYYTSNSDNVIRGTEFIIGSALIDTNNKSLNLSLLDLLFNEKYAIRTKSVFFENFDNKLIEKVKSFSGDKDYLQSLFDMAFANRYRISSNQSLKRIISEVGLSAEMVVYILKKHNMSSDILYLISGFLNEESIDTIINSYKNGIVEFNSVEDMYKLRNWLANNDLKLGIYLQEKFKETGFVFDPRLKTEEEIQQKRKLFEDFRLYNFRLLFDRKQLLKEVEEYFNRYKIEDITNVKFRDIFYQWYNETEFHGIQYSVHTVFETVFRKYPHDSFNLKNIPDLVNDNYFYLSMIKDALNHDSIGMFELEADHLLLIRTLALPLAAKIDFNDIIRINPSDPGRFSLTHNFSYLKLLLFYDFKFEIVQEPDFYLNALEFGNVAEYENANQDSFIARVIARVDDPVAVNNRIIDNINNKTLVFYAEQEHISYALENNLTETFDKIGKVIIASDTLFNDGDILENYIKKIGEPSIFLKACCTDSKSYFYWHVIKLIKAKRLDDMFILEAAINYLKQDDTNFIYDALEILFFLNHPHAIQYYYNTLIKSIKAKADSSGFFPKDTGNYKNLEELKLLPKLFDLIYKKSPFGAFYLYQSRKFIMLLVTNLSFTEEGYVQVKKILDNIKENLAIIEDKEDRDHRTFYINELIDVSYSSHLKSRSEKLSFLQAREIVQNSK